jgi:integrase/recombinase XerC
VLHRIKRTVMPVTLSQGLAIIARIHGPDSQTPRWYSAPIRQLISRYGDIPVTELDEDHLNDWYRFISNHGYSPYTINSYVRAVKAFLHHLQAMHHLNPDKPSPADHLRLRSLPKKSPKGVSPADAARILGQARRDVRDWALVQIVYDTGCRLGELLSMRASDVQLDDDGGRCLVYGKTGSRYIFFGAEAARALRYYLESRHASAGDELWLSYRAGEPLTISGAYQLFKRLAKRAGVTGRFNPHSFRHHAAKRWLGQGMSPRLMQELLGHSDLKTTLEQYIQWSDEELEKEWRRFNQSGTHSEEPE